MIKLKHLKNIELEATAQLKNNKKKFYKPRRDTFQVRVSKKFKPKLKDEAKEKKMTMSKTVDNILTSKYFGFKPQSEIDYQIKLENKKMQELENKQRKSLEIEANLEKIFGKKQYDGK